MQVMTRARSSTKISFKDRRKSDKPGASVDKLLLLLLFLLLFSRRMIVLFILVSVWVAKDGKIRVDVIVVVVLFLVVVVVLFVVVVVIVVVVVVVGV